MTNGHEYDRSAAYQIRIKGILQRYGFMGMLGRMLLLYARSPAYRSFVKGVRQGGVTPKNLKE